MRRSSPSTRSTCASRSSESSTPFRDCPLPDHHDSALQRFAQREEPALELHLTGLDLGQVEDVVDQREQVVGRGEDVVQVLVLLLVHLAEQLLLEHLGEADDRVQRRPQLVAHVGQELGLVLGGDLELRAFLGQLPRPRLQLADIAVDREVADLLPGDEDRCRDDVDVNESPVLARPLGQDSTGLPASGRDRRALLGLAMKVGMRGDHVIDVPANRLDARVAEEALGGGIPRR